MTDLNPKVLEAVHIDWVLVPRADLERIVDQASHVRLGLSARMPNTDGAVFELLTRLEAITCAASPTQPVEAEAVPGKTHCHREGGCIRAFEDETCGEENQCSIILDIDATVSALQGGLYTSRTKGKPL